MRIIIISSFYMSTNLLSDIPVGQKVCLISVNGGRDITKRLLALGLAIGNEVEVLQHRGRGVVVAKGGNRVALGEGVAQMLVVGKPE
jgi:ferrous iron transport protein A